MKWAYKKRMQQQWATVVQKSLRFAEAVQSQLVDVKQIHSTSVAFAAVRQDGSVVTWGAMTGGGDSSSTELMSVVQIHSTTRSFAALQADGKIVTWGASGRFETWQCRDVYNRSEDKSWIRLTLELIL